MPSVRLHWGCKASETVDGEARKCTREHYAHAYCKRHYTASAKGIDPNSLPPLERRPVERPSRAKEPKAPPVPIAISSPPATEVKSCPLCLWDLDAPVRGVSLGTCRKCGAVRPHGEPYEKLSKHALHGFAVTTQPKQAAPYSK